MTALATAVETTRTGQVRLAVPQVPRQQHATGVQMPCAPCAQHGLDKQGLPYRFAGDPTPLCWSCWRSEQQRQARTANRDLATRLWEGIGEAAAGSACQVCGAPEPVPDCWLCGHTWIAAVREQHQAEQAAAADAEAAAVDAEFARIALVSEVENRIADLTGWTGRLRGILTRYSERCGGRAVELLADALARLEAARTSARGRPSVVPPLVAGVLAADSDWRSGRRALPGRERTAWLIGHSDRAVHTAWKLLSGDSEDRWAHRTRIGGRNSLERREETGRWNDRAEFDIRPLAHSPVAPAVRARYLPQALAVLGELLEYAQQLLDAAQAELDGLHAPTGRAPGWDDQARRAQSRQATRRVLAATTTPDAATKIARNICRPHPVSIGECVSSCTSWGLRFSPPNMIHSRQCRAGLPATGRRRDGASRSPTRGGLGDLERCGSSPTRPSPPPLSRPRTPYAPQGASRPSRSRVRPAWADWAHHLARDLIERLPWLEVVRLPRVAATLGARLGPDWTAGAVTAYLIRARGRSLLDAPDEPLAYLAAALDQALTAEDVVPPYPARAHTQHRRQLAVAAAEVRHAEQARLRVALDERDHAGAAERAGAGAGRAAARAVARRAALRSAGRVADWPEVAQPGSGLPPGPTSR